ncbi:MAG: single-stranded DNA-binding protein [Patescibacteria group bacterium]
MRTINKVILIGNITKDPFVKTTQNGKKVVLFTVATNHTFKNAAGETLSESEFSNCVAWGGIADRASQFLVKGKLVYVEGHLKTRPIDREDGTKYFKTEVVISELIFLSKREEAEYAAAEHSSVMDDFSDLSDNF